MRVLYLNPFSQQVSGPDESLLTLLGALIPLGVEAHVGIPHHGPAVARYEALGARVHYVPLTVLRRRMGLFEALSLPFRLARGTAAVARLVRRERIDLIHTNMEVVLDGAVASRILRLPHILHYRGNTLDSPRLAFDFLTRFWTGTSERVICISNATAEIFRKRGLDDAVRVVYNPVRLEAYVEARRSEEVRAALGATPDQVLIGSVGRIHPRKDIATFLGALANVARENPLIRGTVVGAAEAPEELVYFDELKALAVRLGITGRLVWAGARTDIPAVMKALDLFVLSSRHEGFGRVIAEALAAQVSIVATAEGALPELLAPGGGTLADPGSAESFAREIAKFLHSPEKPRDELAHRFSADHIADQILDEYHHAIGASPQRRRSKSPIASPTSRPTTAGLRGPPLRPRLDRQAPIESSNRKE